MLFKNVKTENVIEVTNKEAIDLMKNSDRYIPVKDRAAKPDKPTKLEKTEKID